MINKTEKKSVCFELLTGRRQTAGDNEAHDGHDGQVHDAGGAKEESCQGVIITGDISPDPVVAPGGGHGKGIHGDSSSQVGHRQIHAQQLRRLHPRWPFESHDEDKKISSDGEHSWDRSGRVGHKVQ